MTALTHTCANDGARRDIGMAIDHCLACDIEELLRSCTNALALERIRDALARMHETNTCACPECTYARAEAAAGRLCVAIPATPGELNVDERAELQTFRRRRAIESALTAGEKLAQALESMRPILNDHDRQELDARVELFRKLAADAVAEPSRPLSAQATGSGRSHLQPIT